MYERILLRLGENRTRVQKKKKTNLYRTEHFNARTHLCISVRTTNTCADIYYTLAHIYLIYYIDQCHPRRGTRIIT